MKSLTTKIIIAMLIAILFGLVIHWLALPQTQFNLLVNDILQTGGNIFVTLLKMLVVPVVFVSLVCGSTSINIKKLGNIGGRAIGLYLLTTAIAIGMALFLASIFHIGNEVIMPQVGAGASTINYENINLKDMILNIFPENPFTAFAKGNMLQIIIFALLFGIAINLSGKSGEKIKSFFNNLNHVVMKLVLVILAITPYGIFCLISALVAKMGFQLIGQLMSYFALVLSTLAMQLFIIYPLFLMLLSRLNPFVFLRKLYTVMLFAFTISSSAASIPVVLETVENKLGVKNSVASFVIPLGATINMDGTAIMQGIATVFFANAYHVPLAWTSYLLIIITALLASIGTAGIPSVGLITLAMVLKQVGIPVEGIALIIGIDRLLDMTRTAVNITGDSMIACVVGKATGNLDKTIYNKL